MAKLSSVEALRLRKELLVTRCEMQRLTMALEMKRLQKVSAWVPTVAAGLQSAALLFAAAPVARLVSARSWKPFRSLTATAVLGWRVYRRIKEALRSTNGR